MCFTPQRRALFRHFFDIWTSKSGPRPSVFNTFDLEMCFAPQRRALFRHRNFQKWSDRCVLHILTSKCASRHNGVHFFDTFSTSEPPKVVRDRQFLILLTWKCASRHNGVHFFNISTSKSGLRLRCFVHFDFKMCFVPQRRALFRHRNFQKWSDSCVLHILTSKCASRHNSVHFFDISTSKSGPELRCFVHFDLEMCFAPQRRALFRHLASWLRTRRFSEPTFWPSGATNHWENTVFRDFPIFSRIYIFFLLIFSLLTLSTSAFQLSILSEV